MRKLDFLTISNFSSRSVFSNSDSSYLYSSNHDRIGAKVNSLGCCCEEIFSRPLSRIYLWWEMLFGPVSHKHWHKLQTPNRTSNPWRHSGHLKIKTVLFIIHFYKMFWNLKKKNDFENGTVCQLNVFFIKLFCFSSEFNETWWSWAHFKCLHFRLSCTT